MLLHDCFFYCSAHCQHFVFVRQHSIDDIVLIILFQDSLLTSLVAFRSAQAMAPTTKTQKRTDPGDDQAAAPGTHIAPGNAVIFSEHFEPAIEHLKCLPQFEDWQCPAFLKAGAKDTDNEVGGYMAAFLKRNARLHWKEQNCILVLFCFHSSTTISHHHQALPLAGHKSSQPSMMTPPLLMSSPLKKLQSQKMKRISHPCKACL